MKHPILSLLILGLAVTTIIGCGPEQTAKEKEDTQIAKNVEIERAKIEPLEGIYRGFLHFDNGKKMKVELHLVPTTIVVTNPGRSDVTEIPTMGGSLYEMTVESDKTNTLRPIYLYNASKYDEKQKTLLLFNSFNTPGTFPQSGLQATMKGKVEGNKITGRVSTNLKADVGVVIVTRVSQR